MFNPNHNVDIPGVNVYFASIFSSKLPNGIAELYVPADNVTFAVRKIQRVFRDTYNFSPVRSNSVIKLRRFKVGDYVENPQGLLSAYELAQQLGESDVMQQLSQRPKQVAEMLDTLPTAQSAWDQLASALQEANL